MKFKRLQITNKWQQFRDVDINFHDRVTIITGANGSGKTTLVRNLLAQHSGWSTPSLATPIRNIASKAWSWLTGGVTEEEREIGYLEYVNNQHVKLKVPKGNNSAVYNVRFEGTQSVKSMFIPSHRSLFRYQKIEQIDMKVKEKNQAFEQVSNIYKRRSLDGYEEKPTSFYMKQTLLSWNLFGYGNDQREGDTRYVEYFKQFEEITRQLMPPELGFSRFSIRDVEVIMECESGDYPIDGSSGGISAILDLAWQIFMFAEDEEVTVIIDEIENHLHPKLQRRILPTLVEAFPKVSFIVTTHSPLLIGSVKDSRVYALTYQDGDVCSVELNLTNEAKTASEILDEVLGVSFTMPLWAEEKLNEIVSEFKKIDITEEGNTNLLRSKLKENGLGGFVPSALTAILEDYEKNRQT